MVRKSWAEGFANYIFTAINEERFAVLYREVGSCLNTPVNVLVRSSTLKEYFGKTGEEVLTSIYCDAQFQYALHLTQAKKLPVNDRSWSHFREHLNKHQMATGEYLIKAEMESLSQIIADHMGLNANLKRMDSLMVASQCKRMCRLEFIYTVNSNAVRLLERLGLIDYISQGCAHYLDVDDRNDVI